MEEGLSLEREIVRYSSVSLSPTLGRNEKVEQHIRKKIRKPNALRFWVEGGVISLYVGSVLILVRSPRCFPLRFTQQVVSESLVYSLGEQFDPVSKVFLMEILGKRVPYKCVNGGTSEGS